MGVKLEKGRFDIKLLSKETDRGIAIIGGEFLSNELEEVLKIKLVGNNQLKKKLFQSNGPLNTFSSKIKMAYAMGIISKDVYNNLEKLRDIRNCFSHTYIDINFNTEEISKFIKKFENLSPSLYEEEKELSNKEKMINLISTYMGYFAVKKLEEPFKELEVCTP